nr:receptor-type tyrosine-protein phosphatase beta-like [Rhipicephalus microplus]
MIWEHDVKIIIMLTQFVEGNKSDDSSKWRSLRHVFFTAWKDHGTPEKPETLVQFVRTCQGMFGPRGGSQPPILVHCSAGVGRTGTFIALDMCLQKLEVDEDIDIFHLVLDLRECRRCMVQNEKQYTYLYHCVASVIDEIYGSTVQTAIKGFRRNASMLSRLWVGIAFVNSSSYRIGMADSPNCDNGYCVETLHHVLCHCPDFEEDRLTLQCP